MEEKRTLCKFLKDVKFPDGYASNISRCVNVKEGKCIGLKSHDCHVLFQRLLPLALRGLLPKDVCSPIIELSQFFGELCSKVIKEECLDGLHAQVVETLCKFKRLFPPAFFDIMVHLLVHLANEAKLAGPVQYRWMYPIERYLCTLKGYVRNKARPEGSIAEGYLAEECMTFCSRYLHDIGTRLDRCDRNFDGEHGLSSEKLSVFSHHGKPIGLGKYEEISTLERDQAHLYVLQIARRYTLGLFLFYHKSELEKESPSNVEQRHNKEFIEWFTTQVSKLYEEGNGRVNHELYSLSQCPDRRVYFYGTYCCNGFRFRTRDSEKFLKTQNSGVVVKCDDLTGNVDYHGVITHIIELDYMGGNSVFLFKCDWFEVPSYGKYQSRGYKKDEFGFVSLNFRRLHYSNEPFVLASQVDQVYYVEDNTNKNWRVVLRAKPIK
ncbi:uncharacterized protein LOC119995458 [Tripterygium wilfordii]|uniref:uncharacterized protein LOC119995458 n=1 Tax=Tripterygium wilfordii TaxID=458696 RepID=UPI0018F83CAD|nr:uncharacterized protein LOC119995458 [Tripterygium wilfordii]